MRPGTEWNKKCMRDYIVTAWLHVWHNVYNRAGDLHINRRQSTPYPKYQETVPLEHPNVVVHDRGHTVTEFLGSVTSNAYLRVVQNIAYLVSPLMHVLRKGGPTKFLELSPIEQFSLDHLKRKLYTTTVLEFPHLRARKMWVYSVLTAKIIL